MRLAWATDIHLDFLSDEGVRRFAAELAATGAEGVVVSGDISHAEQLEHHLRLLVGGVVGPVYFVLGNHDYYGSSVAAVREAVRALCGRRPRLRWLPAAGVVELTERTGLVGVDGWADARLGTPERSPVVLNDFIHIEDLVAEVDPLAQVQPRLLVTCDRRRLHTKLRALGEAEAEACRSLLGEALARYERVLVVTHVPPFREACWHEGKLSDDDWLPYFSCAAVGEVLRELAAANPQREITVVCGHTHGSGEAEIAPNLRVLTGGAVYRRPALARVLELA